VAKAREDTTKAREEATEAREDLAPLLARVKEPKEDVTLVSG
jgi:PHD/YefM family antitoxin component YafN of YafNO toxin-antitoxin module